MALQQLHAPISQQHFGIINRITERMPIFDEIKPKSVEYPSSDGLPMAESDFQRKPLTYAADSLELHFDSIPDVYVTGNIFFYYEEGVPSAVVSPDVFVVLGVKKKMRNSYKLWEEGKSPDFVLEITSKSTKSTDKGSKMGLYAFLGIREYFLYDPTTDYLNPPLQGMRLGDDGYYVPLETSTLPDGTSMLHSDVLDLELRVDKAAQLRFYNPVIQHILPNYAEANAIASEYLRRAEREAKRAERETKRAEHEAKRAEHEGIIRREAEVRIAELEAKLRELGIE